MTFPKVYLAVDNCFASKRWTAPAEWAAIVADLGVTCVEASADNECDSLYADGAYLGEWLDQCRRAADATGVHVVNFYSGHGTYATLGLGHGDRRCRDRIQHEWIERMIDLAAALGAGEGFYCHAFDQKTLQTRETYNAAEEELYSRLRQIAQYAAAKGLPTIGLEQMYTPHQIPWTIDGAERLLREVFAGGYPFYLSLDTGHQVGQRRFLRPTEEQIVQRVKEYRTTGRTPGMWLGTERANEMFRNLAADGVRVGETSGAVLSDRPPAADRPETKFALAFHGGVQRPRDRGPAPAAAGAGGFVRGRARGGILSAPVHPGVSDAGDILGHDGHAAGHPVAAGRVGGALAPVRAPGRAGAGRTGRRVR
ncbi:MAG: TIM barrel protein [Planctomycetota bacterium]|nr:TIM barrel protein [Planctomycetota bacterium]